MVKLIITVVIKEEEEGGGGGREKEKMNTVFKTRLVSYVLKLNHTLATAYTCCYLVGTRHYYNRTRNSKKKKTTFEMSVAYSTNA